MIIKQCGQNGCTEYQKYVKPIRRAGCAVAPIVCFVYFMFKLFVICGYSFNKQGGINKAARSMTRRNFENNF